MLRSFKGSSIGFISLFFCMAVHASVSIPLYDTVEKGAGKSVGTVRVDETKYGLLFTPELHTLAPGVHGFHLHEKASCDQDGMAAGGHFDPRKTGKHLGPYNDKGHLGDLPAIYVDANGDVTLPVLAPRLKRIAQLRGHALMVHDGGDNYADAPQKMGGGGGRMVCGVVH